MTAQHWAASLQRSTQIAWLRLQESVRRRSRAFSQQITGTRDLQSIQDQLALLPVPWLWLDARTAVVLGASRELTLLLGRSLCETVREGIHAILDPADREVQATSLLNPATQGPHRSIQLRLLHSNGSVLSFIGHGVPVGPKRTDGQRTAWVLWILNAVDAASPLETPVHAESYFAARFGEEARRHQVAASVMSSLMHQLQELRRQLLDPLPHEHRRAASELLEEWCRLSESAVVAMAQPSMPLDDLVAALGALAAQRAAGLGVKCTLQCQGKHGTLAPGVKQVVYRVVCELLLFLCGMPGLKEVTIELEGADGKTLSIRLRGSRQKGPNLLGSTEIGFNHIRFSMPLGLFGTRMQLAAVGGRFSIEPWGQGDILAEFQVSCGATALTPVASSAPRNPSPQYRKRL